MIAYVQTVLIVIGTHILG